MAFLKTFSNMEALVQNFVSIKDIFEGQTYKALRGANADMHARDIAFSSKDVKEGSLFFCVVGACADGHNFAKDAIERGAVALCVQRELDFDIPQFLVKDSRKALAICSANFFGNPSKKMDIIGITGTNGKTTTTFLVEHIIKSCGQKCGLIGTVECRYDNVKISSLHTTPESKDLQALFAQMKDAGVKSVVMEVSSHAICLDRIAGTNFKVAAFSNLTQDHLDYHKDMESYFCAKAALFKDYCVGSRVICIDDEYGQRLYKECKKMFPDSTLAVSTKAGGAVADDAADAADAAATNDVAASANTASSALLPADLTVKNVDYQPHSTKLTFCFHGQEVEFVLPLVGRFNVENALLACDIALCLGFSFKKVCNALAAAPQVPGRLESICGANGTKPPFGVLVDYAHTPDSVAKAIEALRL